MSDIPDAQLRIMRALLAVNATGAAQAKTPHEAAIADISSNTWNRLYGRKWICREGTNAGWVWWINAAGRLALENHEARVDA